MFCDQVPKINLTIFTIYVGGIVVVVAFPFTHTTSHIIKYSKDSKAKIFFFYFHNPKKNRYNDNNANARATCIRKTHTHTHHTNEWGVT